MTLSSLTEIIEYHAPNGIQNISELEDNLLLSRGYSGCMNNPAHNTSVIGGLYEEIINNNKSVPIADDLCEGIWNHNDALLNTIAVSLYLEEYNLNVYDDRLDEMDREEVDEGINEHYTNSLELYSNSNQIDQFDTMLEFLETSNVTVEVPLDSIEHEQLMYHGEYGEYAELPAILNPAQLIMFPELLSRRGTEVPLVKYGGYVVGHVANTDI